MTSVFRARTRPYGPRASPATKTRTTTTYGAGNIIGTPFVSVSTFNRLVGSEVCLDRLSLTSPYEDHDLTLTKTLFQRSLALSGTVYFPSVAPNNGSQVKEVCSNWSPSIDGSPYNSGLPLLSSPNFSLLETMTLSRFNSVDTPIVDIWQFLYELKEFPKMLRDLGRVLKREVHVADVPGGYLAEKFGWEPLISDALALWDLNKTIHRRLLTLRDHRAGRRFSGKLTDTTNEASGDMRTVYTLGDKTTVLNYRTTRTERSWYVGSVKVTDPAALNALISIYGDMSVGYAITDLVGFARPSASTLWNIIPWSWLIDYFFNIGTFIEAYGNQIPVSLSNLNIMVHQKLFQRGSLVTNTAGLRVREPLFVREHKYRRTIAAPTAKITTSPILTDAQNGILAALSLAGALRRFR